VGSLRRRARSSERDRSGRRQRSSRREGARGGERGDQSASSRSDADGSAFDETSSALGSALYVDADAVLAAVWAFEDTGAIDALISSVTVSRLPAT